MIKIPDSVHALLSPSKAHMWSACKGALAAAKNLPGRPPSRYAAEGTVYHDVSRRALVEDKDCSAYIGDKYEVDGFQFTVDADNADYAQVYVDAIRAIPGKRYVEVDLEYSALLGVPKEHVIQQEPEGHGIAHSIPVAAGTSDIVVLDYENRIIWGVDLKFGRGDVVYASELVPGTDTRKINPQLGLYLGAAVARYELLGITDDWKAIGAIHQPRVNHYDSHTLTVGELRQWLETMKQPANRAYVLWTQGPERVDAMLDLTPGEKQCRWCQLSGPCAAQTAKILDLFPKGHAAQAIPTLHQLDDVELANALDLADEVENWLSAVRTAGLARVLGGGVLPNWKLVTGRRGARAMDENTMVTLDKAAATEIGIEDVEQDGTVLSVADAVDLALGKAAYAPKKLLTVAKLEKPLAKKAPLLWAALQAHVTQSDGQPSLARMEDPRAPLVNMLPEFPLAETGKESLL